MPPWFEKNCDSSGRQSGEEIVNIIAYTKSRVMIVPEKGGNLKLCFPGEVTLENKKPDGSVERTKIYSPFHLQPKTHANVTIVPSQGEAITLYWKL